MGDIFFVREVQIGSKVCSFWRKTPKVPISPIRIRSFAGFPRSECLAGQVPLAEPFIPALAERNLVTVVCCEIRIYIGARVPSLDLAARLAS